MKRFQYTRGQVEQIPTLEYRVHPKNPGILLPVRRSWRRLAEVDYRDPECSCIVTMCTRERQTLFADPRRAGRAKDILLEQCIRLLYRLYAYVIMPDHVHVVMAPGSSGLSIGEIVGRWKSFVTNQLWKLGVKGSPWQRDFDDRVLRANEREHIGLQRMIAYVLENPVRKGLAKDWREYPYCGCFVELE